MLSLPASFSAAMGRAGAEWVYLAHFETPQGDTFYLTQGRGTDSVLSIYPASLVGVAPVVSSLDPLTRACHIDDLVLTLMGDDYVRGKAVANRMRGTKVTVTVGEASSASASFAPYFCGIVAKAMLQRDGTIQLTVANAFSLLHDNQITGHWWAKHPAEVIAAIMSETGIPAALYDATSLDPTQAQWATYSHFNVVRAATNSVNTDLAIRKPTSALSLISELAALVNGQFVARESGAMTFVVYDDTTTPAANWNDNDIDADTFDFLNIDDNAINRVSVAFGKDSGSGYQGLFVKNATDSQSDFAIGGVGTSVYALDLTTDWAEGCAWLATNMTAGAPAAGATFTLLGSLLFGFAGCRWPSFPGVGQPASALASGTRLVYVKIDGEVIECDLVTVNAFDQVTAGIPSPGEPTTIEQLGTLIHSAVFRVLNRGKFGTTAAAHDAGSWVAHDLTMPVYMARDRLRRWKYGVPIVRVDTNLSQYAVQLADFVTIQSTAVPYVAFGQTALSSSIIWEVIGKDADFVSGRIQWTLAWAKQAALSETYLATAPSIGIASMPRSFANLSLVSDTYGGKVSSGLTLSTAAGLVLDVAAGVVEYGTGHKSVSATSLTLIANKDTWVYVDTQTGAISGVTVTTGAAEPATLKTWVRLGKVVSGASITTITSSTPSGTMAAQAISTSALAANTGIAASLGQNHSFEHFSAG